jgi:hypothetical protein
LIGASGALEIYLGVDDQVGQMTNVNGKKINVKSLELYFSQIKSFFL